MFGQHNFHAVLTSVPLLAVPLYSLALACGVRAQPTATAQLTKALLLCFLLSLTVLFCTNLHQHMVGGHLSFRLHDAMAAVQALWNASMLNTLSRRAGLRASIGERAGLVLAVCGTAAVAAASTGDGLDWQEPVCGTVQVSSSKALDRCTPLCLGWVQHVAVLCMQRVVWLVRSLYVLTHLLTVQALTGPFIIGTMGYLSRDDPRAWRLFCRSCAGLLAMQVA